MKSIIFVTAIMLVGCGNQPEPPPSVCQPPASGINLFNALDSIGLHVPEQAIKDALGEPCYAYTQPSSGLDVKELLYCFIQVGDQYTTQTPQETCFNRCVGVPNGIAAGFQFINKASVSTAVRFGPVEHSSL